MRGRRPFGVLLEHRSVRVRLPLPGAGTLHYSSERVPRRAAPPVVRATVLGAEVPHGVDEVDVTVTFDGVSHEQRLRARPHLRVEQTVGTTPINVRSHAEVAVRRDPSSAPDITTVAVGPWDARRCGLGGWQLGFQHHLETDTGILLLARGTEHRVVAHQVEGGWLVERVEAGERLWFDESGRVVTIDDLATGRRRVTVHYDADGMAGFEIDGRLRLVERSANGREVRVTGGSGETNRLVLDDQSWLTSLDADDGSLIEANHDQWGGLVALATPDGTTTASYTADGSIETVVDPWGRRDLVVTEHDGHTRYALVADDGPESSVVVAVGDDGSVTRTSRCCGSPSAIITRTHLDGTREIELADGTRIITTRSRQVSTFWGTVGPLVHERRLVTPSGVERITRRWRDATASGHVEVLEVDGRRHERTYDYERRRTIHVDPTGCRTEIEHTALGRIRSITQAGRPTIVYERDDDDLARAVTIGPLTQSVQRIDEHTVAIISGSQHIELRIDPTTGHVTRTGPDGRTHRLVDDDGWVVGLIGDHPYLRVRQLDDAIDVAFPPVDGSVGAARYQRDRRGRIDHVVESHGTSSVQRDERGIVVGLTSPTGSIAIDRDELGRPRSWRADWGETVRVERDGPLVLAEIAEGRAPGCVETRWDGFTDVGYRVGDVEIVIERDAAGRSTRVGPVNVARDAESGLVTSRRLGRVTSTVRRDEHGRMVEKTVSTDDGSVIARFEDRFDELGRRIERHETIGDRSRQQAYHYDVGDRLTAVLEGGAPVWQATYDERGNRTALWRGDEHTEGAYDARDRLVRLGDRSFRYDDSDRLVAMARPGGLTSCGYDFFGTLVQVDVGDERIQYVSNPRGRRVARYVDGVFAEGYLWRGRDLVATVDAAGAVDTVFVYDDGRVPVAVIRDGRWSLLVTDHLGTPRAEIDPDTASIVAWCDVDPDGRVLDGDLRLALGFGGGVADHSTGQVELGARVYDPELARWTRRDPLLRASGRTNFHQYCSGDPVNRIDPSGLGDMTHPEAPASGVGICANDWGPFDHGSVSVDGKVYGWNPNGRNWTDWKDQTAEKLGDKSFECEEVPDVDPECVLDKIMDAQGNFRNANPSETAGVYDFQYIPPVNVCWNPVFDAIRDCGGDPYAHIPSDDSGYWEKAWREGAYPALDHVNEAVENLAKWAHGTSDGGSDSGGAGDSGGSESGGNATSSDAGSSQANNAGTNDSSSNSSGNNASSDSGGQANNAGGD